MSDIKEADVGSERASTYQLLPPLIYLTFTVVSYQSFDNVPGLDPKEFRVPFTIATCCLWILALTRVFLDPYVRPRRKNSNKLLMTLYEVFIYGNVTCVIVCTYLLLFRFMRLQKSLKDYAEVLGQVQKTSA